MPCLKEISRMPLCSRNARPERFELPTPRFEAWCSIQLSYGRVKLASRKFRVSFIVFSLEGKGQIDDFSLPLLKKPRYCPFFASVAELVDALGLEPSGAIRGGSSPSARTVVLGGSLPHSPSANEGPIPPNPSKVSGVNPETFC
jgi:hypothetical protein